MLEQIFTVDGQPNAQKGLTEIEAAVRLRSEGPNALQPGPAGCPGYCDVDDCCRNADVWTADPETCVARTIAPLSRLTLRVAGGHILRAAVRPALHAGLFQYPDRYFPRGDT
jgi:hypothetical protein